MSNLSLWTDGKSVCIAESAQGAIEQLCAELGEEPERFDVKMWRRIPTYEGFSLRVSYHFGHVVGLGDSPSSPGTHVRSRFAHEWIEELGRGCVLVGEEG